MSGEVLTLPAGRRENDAIALEVGAAPGGFVITGSLDRNFDIYRDNELMHSIKHPDMVKAVAVTPDGMHFFSAAGGTVKVWSRDGQLQRILNAGMWACVTTIVALSDGVHVVLGTLDGRLALYDDDDTLIHTFSAHNCAVHGLAATRDGQHIISGGTQDMVAKVWSVTSKSLLSTCRGHTGHVNAVVAMPDGQRFLSGSGDKTVGVWLLNGNREKSLELHAHQVNALAVLPDNRHALSGSSDSTVKLFNVNDGTVFRTFTHHTEKVNSVALLPDGLRFVSGSWDDTACIVEHGLAPTTTSSEVKMMLDAAEAELLQAQEKVQRAQEKVRYLKQQLAAAK